MRKLIAVALLSLLALASGCASGRTADGREVRGFLWGNDGAGAVASAAGVAGGAVGGAIFGPVGAAVGEHIGSVAAMAVLTITGWLGGRHRGWDEKTAEIEHGAECGTGVAGGNRRGRADDPPPHPPDVAT